MPAGVAVAPVQLPLAPLGRVAQPGDPARSPLRAVVLAPRRPALDDRDRTGVDNRLDPHLVNRVRRDPLLAVVPDGGDIKAGEHRGDSANDGFREFRGFRAGSHDHGSGLRQLVWQEGGNGPGDIRHLKSIAGHTSQIQDVVNRGQEGSVGVRPHGLQVLLEPTRDL